MLVAIKTQNRIYIKILNLLNLLFNFKYLLVNILFDKLFRTLITSI